MTKDEVSLCQRFLNEVKFSPVNRAVMIGYDRVAMDIASRESWYQLWPLFGDDGRKISIRPLRSYGTDRHWRDIINRATCVYPMLHYFARHDFWAVMAGEDPDVWPKGVYVGEDTLLIWFDYSKQFARFCQEADMGFPLWYLRTAFALPPADESRLLITVQENGGKSEEYEVTLYPRSDTDSYQFMRLKCPSGGTMDFYNCIKLSVAI